MLKGNLSTRPFYNDRLVLSTLAAVGAGVLALTVFNVVEVRGLSAQRADFNKTVAAYDRDARNLEAQTEALTRTIDRARMTQLDNGAREANDLIDKRTFSWSAFLGTVEKTLPYGARLVEVQPKPEKGVMHIEILVICQTPDDVDTLLDAMEKTQAFRDVIPAAVNPNDDGTHTALIEAIYLTPPGDPPPGPMKTLGTAPATGAGRSAGKDRP